MLSVLQDGVLTLAFDRPDQLNALMAADMDAMAEAVERAGDDPRVRVVVITGEGRAFCAGADLGAAADIAEEAGPTIDAANRLVRAITSVSRPVVARVQGVAAGVGLSFALACDLVVCDEDSSLLLAFTRVGLMPDGGATAIVAASVGRARALRMALLAERLSAREAQAVGLVSHVWPVEDFEREATALAQALAAGPAVAIGRTKLAINAATLSQLSAAFATERAGQLGLLLAADFREGATAFADRRPPRFTDLPDSAALVGKH